MLTSIRNVKNVINNNKSSIQSVFKHNDMIEAEK